MDVGAALICVGAGSVTSRVAVVMIVPVLVESIGVDIVSLVDAVVMGLGSGVGGSLGLGRLASIVARYPKYATVTALISPTIATIIVVLLLPKVDWSLDAIAAHFLTLIQIQVFAKLIRLSIESGTTDF